MFITMIALWLSWFQMCEKDPVKLLLPDLLRYTGPIIFLTGILIFIILLTQLRGLENIDNLVTSRIYSVLRHPMYVGMIFWLIGYPIFLQSGLTLGSSTLWILNILYWRRIEEKELLEKYEKYKEYKMRTIF